MRNQRSLCCCWLLWLLTVSPLRAVDPSRQISQYAHTAWSIRDGDFRAAPFAITQTNDGYIWIGTASGLARFDGVRFVPFDIPDAARLPSLEILSLLGGRDGSLWIGTHAGLSHWVNQRLVNYPASQGMITAIIEDQDGSIWFTHETLLDGSGPLCHLTALSTHCYGAAEGIPDTNDALSLSADSLGNFWIGADTTLTRWKPGSSTVYSPVGLKAHGDMPGVAGVAFDRDGSMWAGMEVAGQDTGLQHFAHGAWKPFVVPQLDGRTLEVQRLFMDSHNALWIGTTRDGIYRIDGHTVDHFDRADGLSNNEVYKFHEDKEGNIWVVTSTGVDKFSDLQVATYSRREGLSTGEVDSVLAAHDGTLWIGGASALDALRDGKISSIQAGQRLPGNQVTSLFEDYQKRLWVGIDNSLSLYEKGKFRRISKPDGSPFGLIYDITEDIDHNIWLETFGPPQTLIRIRNDKVVDQYPIPRVPPAREVAADPAGGIWLGTRSGDLVRLWRGQVEPIVFEHGAASQVEQLQVNPDGSVLGATASGLIGWKRGVKQTLTTRNGLPCNSILSMISDNMGALWLFTRCGLVELGNTELQKWWSESDGVLKPTVFDEFDGVQPGWAPFQKAAKTSDGRLWFANGSVLQMIDPSHLYKNALVPPVHIERLIADRETYSSTHEARMPPLTHQVEIDYSALSFVVPQKVLFRYKLEGHDVDWQSPGTRRQAFYNDLGPGTYTFRVLACNNDGVWNETGATLKFSVAPAWYQTIWFRVLWITAACIFIWVLYQIRVRSIARALSARFDERLDERTRMALELHDTFLQTVQGSKMVADDALDIASDQLRMRHALEKLSLWLGQAVTEGRAALHALRVSTTERNHLAESLDRSAKEYSRQTSISVALTVIGDAVDQHPIVRDEVARIAEEAIRNACAHSNASQLSIELRYARDLSLCIKDNGVGIIPEIIDAGKAGHYGLMGMRERSARIRARITITSTLNAGTQIILIVPGDVVYRRKKRTIFATLRKLKLWRRPSNDPDSKAKGGDHAERE